MRINSCYDLGHIELGVFMMNGIPDSAKLRGTEFRISSFCNVGNCVSVRIASAGDVMLKDTKAQAGPTLAFTRDEWRAFVAGVKHGEFDA
jgi:Domain of unknown function (DUF397)